MLGSDKSRGYCLEIICADFLAGANLGKEEPEMLLDALHRCFCLLPMQAGIMDHVWTIAELLRGVNLTT